MGEKMRAAELFHPSEHIQEEMDARGWSLDDLAMAMGTEEEFGVNRLSLDFYFLQHPDIVIGEESAERLAKAFGVSKEFFLNLDRSWHEWIKGEGKMTTTKMIEAAVKVAIERGLLNRDDSLDEVAKNWETVKQMIEAALMAQQSGAEK